VTVDDAPRSRSERQAQTRARLIDVARRLFLHDGYAATSLDRVAVEAGYSKGAVYSNFSGKEELCLAVLDSIHEQQIAGVVEAFTGEGDLDAHIDAFTEWARSGIGRPRAMALEVEFAAVARHSTYVADELRERHRRIRRTAACLVRHVADQEGFELEQTPEAVATVLLSLGIGLGALRSLEHDLDVGVVADTMRALLRGSHRA